MANTLKAIFFDRDGVLIHDRGYISSPLDVELIPGVVKLLEFLQSYEIKMFIVTNQSGVARGYFPLSSVHEVNERLISLLGRQFFTQILICPHHPNGAIPEYSIDCQCRKPGIGMIEPIISKHSLKPNQCCLVGDKVTDLQAAEAAGIRGYLYKGGHIQDWFHENVISSGDFDFDRG